MKLLNVRHGLYILLWKAAILNTTHSSKVFSRIMNKKCCSVTVLYKPAKPLRRYNNKRKVHPCTGTEALYRPYGP
jgi:hypothetical protein